MTNITQALLNYYAMYNEYIELEEINRRARDWLETAPARAQFRKIADIGQHDRDYVEYSIETGEKPL